jgi:hypothetical protein
LIRQAGLDFEAYDALHVPRAKQHQADHSASCTQVHDPGPGPRGHELGEQNGIHGKTVSLCRLDQLQAAFREDVYRFSRPQWDIMAPG